LFSAVFGEAGKLKLVTVKSEGLAHNSYYLSDEGEAAVIDPRRDCKIYTRIAEKECSEIKYILETHRNEDYVVGSLELQDMTEAEIGHGKGLPFKYGEHRFDDGDGVNVGSLKIKVLCSAGHTDESVCYVVYTSENPKDAALVFTGDTLFVGSVGRTDLYGKEAQPKQAAKLFTSIGEKLLPLGDHVVIYPAHGSGSVCGGNIGAMEISTLGYERKTNPYLALDEDAFVKRSMSEMLVVPRYFKKMEELNLNGAPLLSELAFPRPMTVTDFEDHMQEPNMLVVDTRNPYAYAGSHVPSSLSLWMGGTSVYPGWVMPVEQYVVFVLERPNDMKRVARRFARLGFDNMCGYLCPGLSEWQEAGKPINSFGTLSVQQLNAKMAKNEVTVADVREPHEWQEGVIDGAKRVFFGELEEKVDSLPRDKPFAMICSVGNRSSIGASILERKGFKDIYNVLGGMTAWQALEYPMKTV
jgi:hydroxyacylglutathione hydrolase